MTLFFVLHKLMQTVNILSYANIHAISPVFYTAKFMFVGVRNNETQQVRY